MKTINFSELERVFTYNDYTAFVINDGTQTMYSGCEIDGNSVEPFETADNIDLYDINELPEIAEIMKENLLAEFEPAAGIQDDGYDAMVNGFANNNAYIAKAYNEQTNVTVYMLIWKTL